MIRAYKYALRLKPEQARIVEQIRRDARSLWNTLVIRTKLVIGDVERGDRYGAAGRYKAVLASKKQVGMANRGIPQIKRNAAFKRLSPASQQAVLQKVKDARLRRKVRNQARFIRTLAVNYACDSLSSNYQQRSCQQVPNQIFHRLVEQYRDSTKRWVKFERGAGDPRIKRPQSPVSLKVQDAAIPVGKHIDLSAFHVLLTKTELVQHRPLPMDGKVKQLALSITPRRVFVVLFVEASPETFSVNFPSHPATTIGIDPGQITPMTAATPDGEYVVKIQPKNAKRTAKHLKHVRRLQRQLDRQRRACNPECFDANGKWVKGRRAHVISNEMKKTMAKIARLSGKLADRRLESHRLAAREILSRADHVTIGTWRPKVSVTEKRKHDRNKNRLTYDNAVAQLAGILQDYASRSTAAKTVKAVKERLTTQTCPDCGAVQKEKVTVHRREWRCENCGTHHDQDVAAARNLANKEFHANETARAQRVSEATALTPA